MSVDFTGEVHAYAAVFPMLPDDDLDALAAMPAALLKESA